MSSGMEPMGARGASRAGIATHRRRQSAETGRERAGKAQALSQARRRVAITLPPLPERRSARPAAAPVRS